MAKTGGIASFSTGEKQTGMVIMPMKFVTAKAAGAKGLKYAKLVDYSNDKNKVSELNNVAVDQVMAAENYQDIISSSNNADMSAEFASEGYATRANAVTEKFPLFNSETLNMNDAEVAALRQSLQEAQDNGNTMHEYSISMRADWLIENALYNPETRDLDQTALKQAERGVVQRLFDKGQQLPLGEGPNDVIWFGVIHQDTDHLNMHLWYTKHSKETRPEMIHQATGEPKGVIKLGEQKRALAGFKNNLFVDSIKRNRSRVYEKVDTLRINVREDFINKLDTSRDYSIELRQIYESLPQDLRGRWKVGNTDSLVTNSSSHMAPANIKVNALIDKMLTTDDVMIHEYADFKEANASLDAMMRRDQGEIHNGNTQKISERNEKRLRKEMANRLYRQFNENFLPEKWIEENSANRQKVSETQDYSSKAEGLVFTDQAKDLETKNTPEEGKKASYSPSDDFIEELERRSKYHRDSRGNFENIKHKYRDPVNVQVPQQKKNMAKKVAVKRGLSKISNTMLKEQRKEIQNMNRFIKNSEREYRRTHDERPFEISDSVGLDR